MKITVPEDAGKKFNPWQKGVIEDVRRKRTTRYLDIDPEQIKRLPPEGQKGTTMKNSTRILLEDIAIALGLLSYHSKPMWGLVLDQPEVEQALKEYLIELEKRTFDSSDRSRI